MTASQSSVEDVNDLLCSMVKEVREARSSHIQGALSLRELLSARWLRALLKLNQCLVQFNRETSGPLLGHASGLSEEITTSILQSHKFSAEARELCHLLRSAHIQALLSSHDCIAQSNYGPVTGSTRTLNCELLRGDAWTESENADQWRDRPDQSAPFALTTTQDIKEDKHWRGGSSLVRDNEDDSYLPPAVPLLSLPNSPVSHRRWCRGLHRKTIIPLDPSPIASPVRIQSAPPTQHSTEFSTLSRCHDCLHRSRHVPLDRRSRFHSSPDGCQGRPERKHVDEKINPHEIKTEQGLTLAHRTKQSNRTNFHPDQAMLVPAEMMQMGENAEALNLLAEAVSKLQSQIVKTRQSREPVASKQIQKPPTPYPRDLSSSSLSSSSSTSDCSASWSREQVNTQFQKVTTRGEPRKFSNCQVRLNNGTFTQASSEEDKKGKSSNCLVFMKKRN